MQAPLLIELLTEELPPKSLLRLQSAFAEALSARLKEDGFLSQASSVRAYSTPRRLAVLISDVLEKSPDKEVQFNGPSVKAPDQAVAGFAKKNGVSVADLIQIETPKGNIFAYRTMASGSLLGTSLDLQVEEALKKLPISKVMRWGEGEAQFVR